MPRLPIRRPSERRPFDARARLRRGAAKSGAVHRVVARHARRPRLAPIVAEDVAPADVHGAVVAPVDLGARVARSVLVVEVHEHLADKLLIAQAEAAEQRRKVPAVGDALWRLEAGDDYMRAAHVLRRRSLVAEYLLAGEHGVAPPPKWPRRAAAWVEHGERRRRRGAGAAWRTRRGCAADVRQHRARLHFGRVGEHAS